ncbi:hypothetical protein ACXGQW_04650 [Wenyingzhuangia sp. IMCC45533]
MKKLFLIISIVLLTACKKEYSTKIKVEKLAETTKSWNGETLLKYADGTPKVTILKITIPPKTQLHMHKHLVINAGVLLTGELVVYDEHGNTKNLKAGEI